MKILILGASGLTGRLLVAKALAQHHEVTALVRDPSKLQVVHEKLKTLTGDALDKEILRKALAGQDAVLSALGRGKSLKSLNLITHAVSVLIPAMQQSNVKRLIFLSSIGVGETFVQANLLQKIIFRTLLKNIFADKTRAEKQIQSSTLDWTLVHPVVLTNEPGTGKYQTGEVLPMKGMPKISRDDVADFMTRQLSDHTYVKKIAILKSSI
ncbi:MAG: SDR family oxidoreductase [Ferruginibacter sp.]